MNPKPQNLTPLDFPSLDFPDPIRFFRRIGQTQTGTVMIAAPLTHPAPGRAGGEVNGRWRRR